MFIVFSNITGWNEAFEIRDIRIREKKKYETSLPKKKSEISLLSKKKEKG